MTQQDDAKPASSRTKPLAIAAGVIVIAMLAVPVYRALSPSVSPSSTPTLAPPVSGKITGPRPEAETTETAPEPSAPAEEPAKAEEPAATSTPESAATPAAPTAKPAPAVKPQKEPRTAASHGSATGTKPEPKPAATPAAAPAKPESKPAEAAPAAPAKHAVEPRSLALKPAAETAQPEGSSVGYRVQLGLFSNLDNAAALIKKLRDNGIAARTETRVSVGPFNTRAEAEEAMTKLKALGLSPMLAPNGKP